MTSKISLYNLPVTRLAIIDPAQALLGGQDDMFDFITGQAQEFAGAGIGGHLIGGTDNGIVFRHVIEGAALRAGSGQHAGSVYNSKRRPEICRQISSAS